MSPVVNLLRSKWLGGGGAGFALLNSFGPEFLPYMLRVSGAIIGAVIFLLWFGAKGFDWIRRNSQASVFHAATIIGFVYVFIIFVLLIVNEKFGLTLERLPTAREIAIETGGGDNYCYFQALLNLPKPGGGYEWQIVNKQKRPIPNMEMLRYQIIDGNSLYLGKWEPATCVTDSVNQTTANEKPIMLGKHYFKFQAVNSWEQSLEIIGGKEPKQIGIVYRNGKEVWRFPDGPR